MISLAATALRNIFVPDPRVDLFIQPALDSLIWQTNCIGEKISASELYHPLDCFGARRVARKLNVMQSPADNSLAIVLFDCRDSVTLNSPREMLMGEPSSAARRSRKFVPHVTSQVRRSTRSTRYDGFKVPNISDTKTYKSKVKPRELRLWICWRKSPLRCRIQRSLPTLLSKCCSTLLSTSVEFHLLKWSLRSYWLGSRKMKLLLHLSIILV